VTVVSREKSLTGRCARGRVAGGGDLRELGIQDGGLFLPLKYAGAGERHRTLD
jgi:hypothetical protein